LLNNWKTMVLLKVTHCCRTTPLPTPSCWGCTGGISLPFPLAQRQISSFPCPSCPDKELKMETRKDTSPQQNLMEEESPQRSHRKRGCKPSPGCSEEEIPTQCQEGGQSFSHSSELVVHEQLHDWEKAHRCLECEKNFRQSSTLISHQMICARKWAYECGECGKGFSCSSAHVIHQCIHTGERGRSPGITRQVRRNSVKYPPCARKVDKSFSHSSELVVHGQLHDWEKAHRCLECGKSFRQSRILISHQMICGNGKLLAVSHSCKPRG
uniref:C2H2-type domain-containing protein n=1 Tax=Zonotrichia albicollis TaxID=44394 RepID=A0A8D2MLB1_ZONAL